MFLRSLYPGMVPVEHRNDTLKILKKSLSILNEPAGRGCRDGPD